MLKFFSEIGAKFVVMWKNMVQPDRLQMTILFGAERRDLHAG
jgi:hypothetical protein